MSAGGGGPVRIPVPELDATSALEVITRGRIELLGRMPWSSNGTFLALAECDGVEMAVVYKPKRGERPLWDFPSGTLAEREVATYVVSEALGWGLVPPTVLRDGPHGHGMVQRFIDHDPDEHYFTLLDDHLPAFRSMAVLDVLANNADRKGGHALHDRQSSRIVGIDHGLTFNTEWKLRTVIWDFGGEPIEDRLLDDVARLRDALDGDLAFELEKLISVAEFDAFLDRTEGILQARTYPEQEPGYHTVPWPLV